MRSMAKVLVSSTILLTVLVLLTGCDLVIRRIDPTPTPGPTSLPGSACSVVTTGELQAWMEDKFPRFEEEMAGGTIYLGPPLVTNCLENQAFYQVRVGYERPGLQVELALLEASIDLVYYAESGEVCLNLQELVSGNGLSPQGIEQVGQELTVAEVQTDLAKASPNMPAETRQRLDEALNQASLQGDPQTQGIGTEGAEILLNWSFDELLERFNEQLAKLIGACIPVE